MQQRSPSPARAPEGNATAPRAARKGARWLPLMLLPYIGLLYPGLYARSTPALFGFPFFYWYQFAWVVLTSMLLGFIYTRTKD